MEFADFIAPFDAETFRAEYWERRPVHLRHDGRNRANILSWQRLNAMRCSRSEEKNFRLIAGLCG
jgi:ribosomal protein L16 Arg81 hydroxylase